MDKRVLLIGVLINLILFSSTGLATSPYISIDAYYNDQLYPGVSTPKPLVKIGEPFTLRFDVTANQYCKVYVKLYDLGTYQGIESFVLVDGPSEFGDDFARIFEANETFTYKWTLKPTERWAGGSMPIDLHYEVQLKDRYGSVVNSEFTAAYVTISNEYYDGPEITEVTASESSSNASSSPTTPAFTALCAVFAVASMVVLRKK